MDDRLHMLQELSEVPGVPGYEGEVRKVIRKYVDGLAEVSQDRLGSIICRKAGRGDRPRVMLAGHMDEIGFMVSSISKEGFLRFQTLGGWWEQVMLAQRVIVKTHKGDVPGVVGSKPPHILTLEERKKMVEKKDMFIDVGATSDEEAREVFGVRPGDPVIPFCPFQVMANHRVLLGKAWDDRLGVALFIEVLRELQGKDHPNTVYGVGTVQEEGGLRGATTSAHEVDPDVAIALEVDIAGDMPGVKEHEASAKLGKGPSVLLYDSSLIPNLKLRDLAIDTAKELGVPLQLTSMAGGGTDAGRMHINRRGVPSLVMSVPTRYIHSHAGIFHLDDYENLVKLLVAMIMRLDAGTAASLAE